MEFLGCITAIANAAYCYRWSSVVCLSVCLSVCVLVTFVSRVKTDECIQMLFGWMTQVGSRNLVLHGVHIPQWEGQFWGLPSSLKSIVSHCCSIRIKKNQ